MQFSVGLFRFKQPAPFSRFPSQRNRTFAHGVENYVRKSLIEILERSDRPQNDTALEELSDRIMGIY